VLGLVQAEFGAAGERERGDETEAGVGDRGAELYATLFEIGDGGIDVVAQEVKLVVASLLSWVHADFGGREAENEPAVASVDVGEFERVAEESAYFFGVIRVDQSVGAGDHDLPLWEIALELQG
jgi:hypothetical protein